MTRRGRSYGSAARRTTTATAAAHAPNVTALRQRHELVVRLDAFAQPDWLRHAPTGDGRSVVLDLGSTTVHTFSFDVARRAAFGLAGASTVRVVGGDVEACHLAAFTLTEYWTVERAFRPSVPRLTCTDRSGRSRLRISGASFLGGGAA